MVLSQTLLFYVLEAKLLLHEKIVVSIMTEFVENEGSETEKQDCERKACFRLMERLKREFPMLPICMCGDSLYACERFFRECGKKKWHFLLRFKEGSIPTVYKEYKTDDPYEDEILVEGKVAGHSNLKAMVSCVASEKKDKAA